MTRERKGEFDWKDGSWTSSRARSQDAELVLSGDWAPIRRFEKVIEEAPSAVYGDLLPDLRQGDLRITNLECPLYGRTPVFKSGAVLKGRPSHVTGLTAVPFDVVTLANNHVFDYGPEAFRLTRDLLRRQAIRSCGAGLSEREAVRPLTIEVKGITIGLVNFSEGEDRTAARKGPGVFGWELERVVRTVRKLKSSVDIVLVIGHCGVEYIAFPPPYVTKAFRSIADAGADLVVGHHPHVPQGIDIHNQTPICYSLGNFVFYQETELRFRKLGYLVKAGLSKAGVSWIRLVPYEIGSDRLIKLTGARRRGFLTALERVSRPLSDDGRIEDAWHAFLRFYGVAGFKEEVGRIMGEIEREPRKGAAMFRNRIVTMQHREHWMSALSRIVDGTISESSRRALDLQVRWLTEVR